jgi:hypothetical protein
MDWTGYFFVAAPVVASWAGLVEGPAGCGDFLRVRAAAAWRRLRNYGHARGGQAQDGLLTDPDHVHVSLLGASCSLPSIVGINSTNALVGFLAAVVQHFVLENVVVFHREFRL